MATEKGRGAFITLEGCEGCGKSTQSALLCDYLKKSGHEVVLTREPGGTLIAEKIREIILDGENRAMRDKTEALLYAAARIQHVEEKILPLKEQGKIVVCDRFIDSSFAYQAFARGLGYEFVERINSEVIKTCMPDLTLFFDLSPEKGFARKGGADKDDRVEQSGMEFHKRVYGGYIELARMFPSRIVSVDASGTEEEVFGEVKKALTAVGLTQ